MIRSVLPADTSRLHDLVLVAIGSLGGMIGGVLAQTDLGLVSGCSIGLNVAFFLWAYTLHEGWHLEEQGR